MRDEQYILSLCDRLLRRRSLRQHRFAFLLGDSKRRLPVDAYYPDLKLVIEYRERQHTEPVAFFDRRSTVSGVPRGVQRALYDQRRREVLPQRGINLIELCYSDFSHGSGKRLKRIEKQDLQILREKLRAFVAQPCLAPDRPTAPPLGTRRASRAGGG